MVKLAVLELQVDRILLDNASPVHCCSRLEFCNFQGPILDASLSDKKDHQSSRREPGGRAILLVDFGLWWPALGSGLGGAVKRYETMRKKIWVKVYTCVLVQFVRTFELLEPRHPVNFES